MSGGGLGSGLIISGPQPYGCECHSGKVVSRQFVEACCDPPEVLNFIEVSFDEVSFSVNGSIYGALDFAVPLGRYMGGCPAGLYAFDKCPCIISPIRHHMQGPAQTVDQPRGSGLVGGLSRCDRKADWQSGFVNDRIDLAAQSSTRTANGVIRAPFFPPAAC